MTLFGTRILSDLQTSTLANLSLCCWKCLFAGKGRNNLEKNKQFLSVVDFMLLGSLDKKSRNALAVCMAVM